MPEEAFLRLSLKMHAVKGVGEEKKELRRNAYKIVYKIAKDA